MFFEPKDIKYFRPVEIYTRNGLKVSLLLKFLTLLLEIGPH